jgi:hypothetical protein
MRDTYCAPKKEESMTDYLPEVYQNFERRFPAVKEAFDALGIGVSEAEIVHTIVLALTTIGFPPTNAALSWAEEVLSEAI